jgi:predicted PurR-regulated permease PerM
MQRTPTRNVVSREAVTVNEVSGGGAHKGRADEASSAVVMPAGAVAAMEEEHEVLHASIRAASVAQVVIAVVAVLGLFYLAKVVLVTICMSLLIAFILEPLVNFLNHRKIPRPAGALLAVVLLLALLGAFSYFFYNRALAFAGDLPKYSTQLRETIGKVRSGTDKIAQNTEKALSPSDGQEKKPMPVQVEEKPGIYQIFSGGLGVVGDLILTMTFIPFLVYFMLSWKDHAHRSTVRLFPEEHRPTAHRTIGRISNMIRSFIVANVVVAVMNSVISALIFWQLHIQYAYFVGVISGFASLIPYLGVILAVLPPLAGGIGVLHRAGAVIVVATVLGLHLVSVNVLYPKLVGRRLRLNPLAVTLALLFWAWIWGAMGLILAIPMVGATKIICDHVDSLRGLGAWLGDRSCFAAAGSRHEHWHW